jgi:foldase protein PrsA
MRITKTITALGAAGAAALAIAGCGSGVSGNSVASVAGNPITVRAYDHWMYVVEKGNVSQQSPNAPVIVPNDPPDFSTCISDVRAEYPTLAKDSNTLIRTDCQRLFTSLNSTVLGFLIEAYWYQADAHRLGISLSNAQIRKAFEVQKKANFPSKAAFTAYLKESGQTMADVLYRVRIEELQQRLLKRFTKKVDAAAVSTYYDEHPSEFGTPETRNVRLVLTKTRSRAQAALSALRSGQSWNTVARTYSTEAATKNDGGLETDVTYNQLEHAVNQVVFSSPTGKLAGPIHGQFGWYVVEVVKITPPTKQPLSKVAPEIKQILTSEYTTDAEDKITAISKRYWGSRTICRSAYSISDCAGYKAPQTSTTTTR